jgi:hypothetical protein
MFHIRTIIIALFIGSGLFYSCSSEMQSSLKSVPTAFGTVNQIIVVMDQEMWDGSVGDTLRYYYSAAYPVLPQPEPMFDLKHFTPYDLAGDRLRKELRSYLIVGDINDTDSPTAQLIAKHLGETKIAKAQSDTTYNSNVGKDKWAKGQILIYQMGLSTEDLVENLKRNYPAIKKRINQNDRIKVEASVYLDGESKALQQEIKDKLGVKLRVPSDYFLALNNEDVIWLRKETNKASSNIILKKMAYADQSQLSKDTIKSLRDTIGRRYVSSTIEDTYMRTNDFDLPMLTMSKKVRGQYALEARGIWEIVNDFMGGAFISYLVHSPSTNELIFIDGFVYAPGEEKREYIQNLEHIFNTIEFQ